MAAKKRKGPIMLWPLRDADFSPETAQAFAHLRNTVDAIDDARRDYQGEKGPALARALEKAIVAPDLTGPAKASYQLAEHIGRYETHAREALRLLSLEARASSGDAGPLFGGGSSDAGPLFRANPSRPRSFKAKQQRATEKRENQKVREKLHDAVAKTRRARASAKTKCDAARSKCDAARAVYLGSRKDRDALRTLVREYRLIRRAELARARGARSSASERRAESDDAVRANLPPELHPTFERVKQTIKPAPRMSRTETFLQWVHEHPAEVFADDAALIERGAETQALDTRESAYAPLAATMPDADQDFSSWLATANPSGLVALGWLSRLELVNGQSVRVPRGTLLAYDPKKKRGGLALVFGAQTSRATPPEGAAKEYAKTHWGDRGAWGVSKGELPEPKKGSRGSPVARVVYTTKKGGDRALTDYEHPFEEELPRYIKCSGATFQIVGGSYRVTSHGIVG